MDLNLSRDFENVENNQTYCVFHDDVRTHPHQTKKRWIIIARQIASKDIARHEGLRTHAPRIICQEGTPAFRDLTQRALEAPNPVSSKLVME
jgi:hypothetical protein